MNDDRGKFNGRDSKRMSRLDDYKELEKAIEEKNKSKLNESIEWGQSTISTYSYFLNNKNYSSLGVDNNIRNYRKISMYPEVWQAIRKTVNDMIIFAEDKCFELKLKMSNNEKKAQKLDKVEIYFEEFVSSMNFKDNIHTMGDQWYIDGVLAIYKKKMEKEKRYDYIILDPLNISRIYSQGKWIFKTITTVEGVPSELEAKDMIWVESGLKIMGVNIGYLHNALKPANNLEVLRDALLVWRLVRAPKRLVFYVDTANMSRTQAKAHLDKLSSEYNSNMHYNSSDGSVDSDKAQIAITQNIWMNRAGDKTTEITEIGGDASLGDIDDYLEAKKTLYRSMGMGISSMLGEADGGGTIPFSGNYTEVSREAREWYKHINRLRNHFSKIPIEMFIDWCEINNKLKRKELENLRNKLYLVFYNDMEMDQQMKFASLLQKIDILDKIKDYTVNPDDLKLFTKDYIEREILGRNDYEQKINDEELKKDINGEGDLTTIEEEPTEDTVEEEPIEKPKKKNKKQKEEEPTETSTEEEIPII